MFNWFRKRNEEILEFPDGPTAFDYACRNLPNRVLIEAVLPALIEGVEGRGSGGERFFRIRLADAKGGREMSACTLAEANDWPQEGDLVGFRVVMADEDRPEIPPVGYISSVLEPVLVGRKGWRISRNLTPANIKQTIRF